MTGARTVAVGSLGGTITMVGGDATGGTPQLGASDLVGGMQVDDLTVRSTTLQRLPSASLTPEDVVRAAAWARGQAADGCDGVVLVQGTDTLAESAFFAGLYWDEQVPLVLTGAMRLASALSPDGPANLRDACVAASSPGVAAHGVLVCLNGALHRADRVEKSHSWGTDAFTSGPAGLAGVVREGAVHLYPAGMRSPSRALAGPVRDPRVALVSTYLGDDGRQVEQVASGVDALVVEGYGAGHVPARVADVLADLATRLPVVVCTSVERGGTLTGTYGFRGSEIDLAERGVLLGGGLSARKARLLAWAWLAQGEEPSDTAGLARLLAAWRS